MKKFYPNAMIRYFSGVGLIFLLVVMPSIAGIWGARIALPEEKMYFILPGLAVSLMGFLVINHWFWEKCFSHLELSDKEIRWRCPLRADRMILAENCIEIGAYIENAGNGIPTEQVYFSDYSNPMQDMGKNGVMKASKHLIKFCYSEELYKYLQRTYSGKQISCLSAYRQRRKRW